MFSTLYNRLTSTITNIKTEILGNFSPKPPVLSSCEHISTITAPCAIEQSVAETADALPADALPTDALPADALPTDALPAAALPAAAMPLTTFPTIAPLNNSSSIDSCGGNCTDCDCQPQEVTLKRVCSKGSCSCDVSNNCSVVEQASCAKVCTDSFLEISCCISGNNCSISQQESCGEVCTDISGNSCCSSGNNCSISQQESCAEVCTDISGNSCCSSSNSSSSQCP